MRSDTETAEDFYCKMDMEGVGYLEGYPTERIEDPELREIVKETSRALTNLARYRRKNGIGYC